MLDQAQEKSMLRSLEKALVKEDDKKKDVAEEPMSPGLRDDGRSSMNMSPDVFSQ